jgi:hypothetical protein
MEIRADLNASEGSAPPGRRRRTPTPELERPGVYVLVDSSGISAKHRVYLGKAEMLRKPLDQRQANKGLWTQAIAFTTKVAHQAGRDEIENSDVLCDR